MSVFPKIEEIDFSSLRQTVTATEIEAYRSRNKKCLPLKYHWIINGFLWAIVITVLFLQAANVMPIHAPMLVWPIIGTLTYTLIIGSTRVRIIHHVRMSRFASQHGMVYEINPVSVMAGNGLLFSIGHSRSFREVLYKVNDDGGRAYEIGTYQYTVGSGKNKTTYTWRYACVDMKRNLPHMVLDAKGNNQSLFGKKLKTGLPIGLQKKQIVSLEGNFDDYFTLYAPENYDVDVRYIFTPDIMQLMIAESAKFDAEVVDDKLYFYAREFGEADKFIESAMRLIGLVGQKFYNQADYYADDRVSGARENDTISEEGRRLRRLPGARLVVILIFIIYIFITFVHGGLSGR